VLGLVGVSWFLGSLALDCASEPGAWSVAGSRRSPGSTSSLAIRPVVLYDHRSDQHEHWAAIKRRSREVAMENIDEVRQVWTEHARSFDRIEVVRQAGSFYRARTMIPVNPLSPYRSFGMSGMAIVTAWGRSGIIAADRCRRKRDRLIEKDLDAWSSRKRRMTHFSSR
jgi:hypothetical protein